MHGNITSLGYDICVSMHAGDVTVVNTVVKDCVVVMGDISLKVNLVVINLRDFDVILGMDCLSRNHAVIDCQTKELSMEILGHRKVVMVGERKMVPNYLVSAMKAFQLIRSGCDAYLANVIDTTVVSPGVSDVPIVNEFLDVFLEELPGLPPQREVEFQIETIPGVALISIAPYRMAPAELKELKKQLEELLYRGFIRPSIFPWGALVLFVRKKDGSMIVYQLSAIKSSHCEE